MKRAFLAVMVFVSSVQLARADKTGFVGNLVLEPPNCEAAGLCTLGEDFGFMDPQGIGWQTKKGDKTDGASIPGWAQPFVGKPFEPAYIKAAVIHDHYCDRHVRAWKETHRVFFDALMASGVSSDLADLLYGAVYLGGPRWRDTIPGIKCPVGKQCVENVPKPAPEGTSAQLTDEGKTVLFRPEQYTSPEFSTRQAQLTAFIKSHPEGVSPEQIAQAADQIFPDKLFSVETPFVLEANPGTKDK